MRERIEDIVRPSGQDLTESELLEVAREVASCPEFWAKHVDHESEHRTYAQLFRDDNVDVWLICWSEDQDTGFHDHDLSAGAVAVVDGAVREERLVLGRSVDEPISRVAEAGASFTFGASEIHRVLHSGEGPAVTIHAYSPPLVRMGSYTVESNGQLRRFAVSYDEELRQLETS